MMGKQKQMPTTDCEELLKRHYYLGAASLVYSYRFLLL